MISNISYNTLMGTKFLQIRINKIKNLLRVYDGTRYLVLFGCGFIYNRIRYLTEVKVVLTYGFFIIMQKSI